MAKAVDESSVAKFANWLVEKSVNGVPPLVGAQQLADEYLLDKGFADHTERAWSLVKWECSKNFTSGYLTGLGGVLTLPVSIPTSLGASYLVQARMAAAIAVLFGHRLNSDRVRTLVLLCLVGDAGKEVVKQAGIKIGRKTLEAAIRKIPGTVLIKINQKVTYRLVTKAGEKGIVNLIKIVPLAGGIVGGTVDASMCYGVGRTAISLFAR